ncbi:hypothetical protein PISMIDRAFT_680604 [Pisolithus microcarpus 441]|uniref:Unplaced genomic scaffold scaffold_59, whole genome shotgun sequence n=1 Tax=Pisolithus microcarpus 441 TaxID=765257 RepID=A0A0C9ZQV1_9AGAM|nr:hypothetical protein PISMIDRAFT_680604 [Pisolithus microcarpus 441]
MPHDIPCTLPTPSHSNLNTQAHRSPNPPLRSLSEIYRRNYSSGIGSGNLPTLAAPPVADYLRTKVMMERSGVVIVRQLGTGGR